MKDKIEGKNIINFYIRTLTPLHVGAAQEAQLANGIDFLVENGKIFFIDEKKILKDFKLHQYTNSLSKGNLKGLLQNKDIGKYAKSIESNIVGEIGSNIKTNIKNTLDDKPYIPGSSLKGAIRSVIFNKVKSNNGNKESDTFGWIPEDPFRYFIVGDALFNESTFVNTKTFNLFQENREWHAGWKHNLRGQNTGEFKPSGFTFPYECISPDCYAKCKIIINQKSYETAKNRRKIKIIDFFNQLSYSTDHQVLFQTIQEYTKKYIEKEIAFFEKYSNQETDIIIEEYKRLLELNKEAPVLRIGQGSGFHSITGDHKFINHLVTINNHGKKYKSRKFAFTKVNGEYKFYPMGFVQLLLPEQIQDKLQEIEKRKKESLAQAEEKAKKDRLAAKKATKIAEEKLKADRLAAENAKKPQFSNYTNFNPKKRYDLEAVVYSSGFPNKVNVYVKDGYIEQDLKLDSYRSPIEVGKVIVVTVSVNKKGKITQASFKKFKNN